MSAKKREESLTEFLKNHKEEFLRTWQDLVDQSLTADIKRQYRFSAPDFEELFSAYINGSRQGKLNELKLTEEKFIKQKINAGFPLSILSIINIHFMATARDMVRSLYPDAFNARMEYLESLSQRVLHNEIILFQYYERHVSNLNAQLREQTEALRRKNSNLIEYIDLATNQLQAPLWSILGFTSKLQRKYYAILKEEGKHYLNRILANVSEMHQLIEDMTAMLLIDPETMKKRDVFLHDVLSENIKKIQDEIDNNFKVRDGLGSLTINGDPDHLRKLFFYILKNAAQYTKGEKSAKVNVHYKMENGLHLYFEDDGIGIAKEYRELVWRPLERLKEKEVAGSGLGLTLARRIVTGHNGRIELQDSRYGGVCVHITLPYPKESNIS